MIFSFHAHAMSTPPLCDALPAESTPQQGAKGASHTPPEQAPPARVFEIANIPTPRVDFSVGPAAFAGTDHFLFASHVTIRYKTRPRVGVRFGLHQRTSSSFSPALLSAC